jgi:hypothetical protein
MAHRDDVLASILLTRMANGSPTSGWTRSQETMWAARVLYSMKRDAGLRMARTKRRERGGKFYSGLRENEEYPGAGYESDGTLPDPDLPEEDRMRHFEGPVPEGHSRPEGAVGEKKLGQGQSAKRPGDEQSAQSHTDRRSGNEYHAASSLFSMY